MPILQFLCLLLLLSISGASAFGVEPCIELPVYDLSLAMGGAHFCELPLMGGWEGWMNLAPHPPPVPPNRARPMDRKEEKEEKEKEKEDRVQVHLRVLGGTISGRGRLGWTRNFQRFFIYFDDEVLADFSLVDHLQAPCTPASLAFNFRDWRLPAFIYEHQNMTTLDLLSGMSFSLLGSLAFDPERKQVGFYPEYNMRKQITWLMRTGFRLYWREACLQNDVRDGAKGVRWGDLRIIGTYFELTWPAWTPSPEICRDLAPHLFPPPLSAADMDY